MAQLNLSQKSINRLRSEQFLKKYQTKYSPSLHTTCEIRAKKSKPTRPHIQTYTNRIIPCNSTFLLSASTAQPHLQSKHKNGVERRYSSHDPKCFPSREGTVQILLECILGLHRITKPSDHHPQISRWPAGQWCYWGYGSEIWVSNWKNSLIIHTDLTSTAYLFKQPLLSLGVQTMIHITWVQLKLWHQVSKLSRASTTSLTWQELQLPKLPRQVLFNQLYPKLVQPNNQEVVALKGRRKSPSLPIALFCIAQTDTQLSRLKTQAW